MLYAIISIKDQPQPWNLEYWNNTEYFELESLVFDRTRELKAQGNIVVILFRADDAWCLLDGRAVISFGV